MNTPVKQPLKLVTLVWQLHMKIASWSAHLIGPIVFSFGSKEKPWKMNTADFLSFPERTAGRALGEFLKKDKLEPIAGAESHDLYHVLFDYSSSFTDEVALQFFLRGNGKNSIASFGAAIGAWIVLPTKWSYLKASYRRGKDCSDISTLDLKAVLFRDLDEVKASLTKNKTEFYYEQL